MEHTEQKLDLGLAAIRQCYADPEIRKVEVVQTLWSGYGEIARYWLPCEQAHVIVKTVNPNQPAEHPRGWNSSFSHQRKLDSYQNEQRFYQNHSGQSDQFCRLPQCQYTGHYAGVDYVIMEDLDESGFPLRFEQAPLKIIELGIRWLAYFHACYICQQQDDLWPVGTYWHLKTRPDEWQKMPAGELKDSAQWLDDCLNGAAYKTLLHGDAKLANFCFADTHHIAAVDFQYVGKGVGVKDLIYYLGSCLDGKGLFNHANDLTKQYFSYLATALEHYQKGVDVVELEAQWRQLIPLAWADFDRFLAGWATEHVKRNSYMKQQTNLALRCRASFRLS